VTKRKPQNHNRSSTKISQCPHKTKDLMFSKILNGEFSLRWKIWSFFSFQITQVLANQINSIKGRLDFAKPVRFPKWRNWFVITLGSDEWMSNHFQTRCQIEPKKLQSKNKWFIISNTPQPPTQDWDSWVIKPFWNKFPLVGNLFRKKPLHKHWYLHKNIHLPNELRISEW
jgi:hypothetical protein